LEQDLDLFLVEDVFGQAGMTGDWSGLVSNSLFIDAYPAETISGVSRLTESISVQRSIARCAGIPLSPWHDH
jgi:hypothetical protein